jgi:hypothetical protein
LRFKRVPISCSAVSLRTIWSDWHTAPRRQYIFILAGQMEIGIGDGTTRRFGPGDAVLADDLTGQGHTTRLVGVPRISATVPVGA